MQLNVSTANGLVPLEEISYFPAICDVNGLSYLLWILKGVVVRPGATVKCDPGEFWCHVSQIALHDRKGNEEVRVFVKVDGKEFWIGKLSVDKYPQCKTSLVFEKESRIDGIEERECGTWYATKTKI
ncbi:Histone deacetylase HDT2 [Zea mays]|uniref:Histone deacetylase HDT2 n=1 Tax=Zea mays TaxID=4577 RepID=A0A3L6ERZ4_MAIZE|nr:Histone deacetylase HDT2 [Zea mays]